MCWYDLTKYLSLNRERSNDQEVFWEAPFIGTSSELDFCLTSVMVISTAARDPLKVWLSLVNFCACVAHNFFLDCKLIFNVRIMNCIIKGKLRLWIFVFCYLFSSTWFRGCLKVAGFDPLTLRLPAWCHVHSAPATPVYKYNSYNSWKLLCNSQALVLCLYLTPTNSSDSSALPKLHQHSYTLPSIPQHPTVTLPAQPHPSTNSYGSLTLLESIFSRFGVNFLKFIIQF